MILNKEDIKVGDWYKRINVKYPFVMNNEILDNAIEVVTLNKYIKWTPQKNEVCIFWNNGDTPLTIGKFIKTTKQGNFLCESKFSNELDSQIPFGNIAPVTFDLSVYGL